MFVSKVTLSAGIETGTVSGREEKNFHNKILVRQYTRLLLYISILNT